MMEKWLRTIQDIRHDQDEIGINYSDFCTLAKAAETAFHQGKWMEFKENENVIRLRNLEMSKLQVGVLDEVYENIENGRPRNRHR